MVKENAFTIKQKKVKKQVDVLSVERKNNMDTKETILDIIKTNIKREGVDKLVEMLETSDYFTAPASTQYHSCGIGGLADHSLSVYKILKAKNTNFKLEYTDETIAIVGLFHDICKVDFYKKKEFEPATGPQLNYLKSLSGTDFAGEKLSKGTASKLIEQYKGTRPADSTTKDAPEWSVDDQLPLGHGEKSIFVLAKYLDLEKDEALAIRWHMGAFDPGIHFNYPSGFSFRQANEECKLVAAVSTSDFESDKLLGI